VALACVGLLRQKKKKFILERLKIRTTTDNVEIKPAKNTVLITSNKNYYIHN
jgi:hypothetical protein